jgi:hypothetical protein
MNNDAFRKLLNEGGLGKSTKQIAREAVEDEFKMKRRKGQRSGYNSDDDDDDDDNNEQKWKRKKGIVKDEEKVSCETYEKKPRLSQYRDRAKERREGKVVDYEELHNIDHVDAEMSKYLGGDEKYTHLVKGLDTTLAEKVRRQEMGDFNPRDDIDLDKLMEETVSKTSERAEGQIISKGKEGLQNAKSSSLVLGMTSYLNSVKNNNNHLELPQTSQIPMSGQRIARTTLNFTIRANVGDRLRSWELPQESISSAAQYDRMRNLPSSIGIATPLDANLIDKIKNVFSSRIKESTVTKTISEDKKSVESDSDEDIFSD